MYNLVPGSLDCRESEDGSLQLHYEDYNEYGSSYDVYYQLDAENAERLSRSLPGNGSLCDRIYAQFGEKMEKDSFIRWCETHQIEEHHSIWYSDWDD